MKKVLIIIFIVLLLLVPIPIKLKDGGSIEYKALFYNVTKIHRLNHNSATGYEDGWKVEILGVQIYNKTDIFVEAVTIEELNNIQKQITDKIVEQTDYNNFASCGVDEQRKVVVVELIDNSIEQQQWFKNNILDSRYIVFEQGGPYTTFNFDCLENLLGGYIASEFHILREIKVNDIIDADSKNIDYFKAKVTDNGFIYLIIKSDESIMQQLDNYFESKYKGYQKTKTKDEYYVYIYNGFNDFKLDEILDECFE